MDSALLEVVSALLVVATRPLLLPSGTWRIDQNIYKKDTEAHLISHQHSPKYQLIINHKYQFIIKGESLANYHLLSFTKI